MSARRALMRWCDICDFGNDSCFAIVVQLVEHIANNDTSGFRASCPGIETQRSLQKHRGNFQVTSFFSDPSWSEIIWKRVSLSTYLILVSNLLREIYKLPCKPKKRYFGPQGLCVRRVDCLSNGWFDLSHKPLWHTMRSFSFFFFVTRQE